MENQLETYSVIQRSIRLAMDTMFIYFDTAELTENANVMAEAVKASLGSMRVVILRLNSSKHSLNVMLNKIFRVILTSAWQTYPLALIVIVNEVMHFIDKDRFMKRINDIASVCLIDYVRIRTSNDLKARINDLPGEIMNLSDGERLVMMSNAVRLRSLQAIVDNKALCFVSADINLVGWNEFEVIWALNLGLMPTVYEIAPPNEIVPWHKRLHRDPDVQKTLDNDYSYNEDIRYLPPSKLKLHFLHAKMWAETKNNLVYIGGYPGDTLHMMDAKLLRGRLGKEAMISMYDPKFDSREGTRAAWPLFQAGFRVVGRKFSYGDEAMDAYMQVDGHLLFNDDAYTTAAEKDAFLIKKIRFFSNLISARKAINQQTKVILKFQFPRGRDNFAIPFFEDILFQPAVNDSTEVRVIMSSEGTSRFINAEEFAASVNDWRQMSLRDQYNSISVYFKHLIEVGSVFDKYKARDTLVSFAFTSALTNKKRAIDGWKRMIARIRHEGCSIMVILPNNVINDSNSFVTYKSKHMCYHDWTISESEIWELDLYSINPLGIRSIVDRYMNIEQSDLRPALRGLGDFKLLPRVLMGGVIERQFIPQSVIGSPGPLIKCFTLAYRINFNKTQSYTYNLRMRLLRKLTNIDELKGTFSYDSASSFHSESRQTLLVMDGTLKGKSITLTAGETMDISGHLLNLLISRQYSFDLLKLWIKQWAVQSTLTKLHENSFTIRRMHYLQKENLLIDYNPDGDKGLFDPWHSRNDIFCALVIANDYMIEMGLNRIPENQLLSVLAMLP